MMKQRLNVLIVGENIYKSKGGIVTFMKSLIENDDLIKEIDYRVISITGNKFNFNFLQRIFEWMKGIFKIIFNYKKYDIIHINHASNYNFILVGILTNYLWLKKVRVILHNHGGDFINFYENSKQILKKFITSTLLHATCLIAPNKKLVGFYKRISKNINVYYLPNGVNTNLFIRSKIIKDPVILLYLSSVEKNKGIYDILEALKKIIDKNDNFILKICGQGELKKLRKLINKNNLNKYIEIEGFVENEIKTKILKSSNVFLLPSYYESFPYSLLEAMSYGVVPIASNVGGVPEIILNGFNGFLIKPGDKSELSYYIDLILNNKNLLENLSKNARESVVRSYNIKIFNKRLLKIYKKVLLK